MRLYLSTIRSKVRLRRQSVRPFSASATSRPHGMQGNFIMRGGPSLRRRPRCPGDRCMDGDGGWGPRNSKIKTRLDETAEGDITSPVPPFLPPKRYSTNTGDANLPAARGRWAAARPWARACGPGAASECWAWMLASLAPVGAREAGTRSPPGPRRRT